MLGEILIEAGLLTQQQLAMVLRSQRASKRKLGEELVKSHICTEEQIATAVASQLGLPHLDLHLAPIEPPAIQTVPEDVARKHRVVPITIEGDVLNLAMADPLDLDAIQDVQFASGLRLRPHVATASDVLWAIDKHYGLGVSIESLVKNIGPRETIEVHQVEKDPQEDISDLRKQSEAAPIITMVNRIIATAAQQRASDIHLEPHRACLLVRQRVDGYLRKTVELPKWVQGAIVSRIKVMAKMDISEKRVPQDGRISATVGPRTLDMRVSTMPTCHGEKVVIRLLDVGSTIRSISDLGFDEEGIKKFKSLISSPQGIVLVTGPTGSGKTTTLYAAMSEIKSVETNITTIEDPIEYEMEGVNQVGINEKAGRTFASVLPAILRQDPDVIMLGEMRDAATATTAMQASLTGHLVLSTLHTNNTLASITRLRDLGIPSYLIASTISGVIAQRLARMICPSCKIADTPRPALLDRIGVSPDVAKSYTFYRGRGCGDCGGTGFQGRTAIYEILVLSHKIREQIAGDAPEAVLRQLALAEGMSTLVRSGIQKVKTGKISVEELLRVIQTDEDFRSMCPECAAAISPGFVACPQCGTRLTTNCPECRTDVDPTWQFCPYCAHRLVEGDEISTDEIPETIPLIR